MISKQLMSMLSGSSASNVVTVRSSSSRPHVASTTTGVLGRTELQQEVARSDDLLRRVREAGL